MKRKNLLKSIFPSLDENFNLEARVNNAIRCATCEPDPNKSIDIILEFLGKELDGERSYIFEKNSSGGDDNTYEWTAEGVTPEKSNLQNIPPQVCESWYRFFSEGKDIMYDDIEKILPEDPLKYQILKEQNINSIIVVPLYGDEQIIGFYGIDNPPVRNMERSLNMLRIVGYFIGSMITRRNMINRLKEISMTDQLTKLGNRHAMEEYIAGIKSVQTLGIVYCDITGLKRINDTMGHQAGDNLICRAAESLKNAFEEYGLFRIGGDELLAICKEIDEKSMQERVEHLKKISAENSVNLAVGSIWSCCCEKLQTLMTEAEALMYKEKEIYYRSAGHDRRR